MRKIDDIMDMTEIRFKGVFDWDGLYHLIRKWFDDRKYVFLETKYKDKTGTPFGNEVEVKMAPYRRVSEFVRYTVKMEVKIWDYKEFEAEINGEKRMVTDGRLYVKLIGIVEIDYANRFNTPFEEKLRDTLISIFSKYFEIRHYDNLTYSLYDFQKEIKEYLNMETGTNAYQGSFPG